MARSAQGQGLPLAHIQHVQPSVAGKAAFQAQQWPHAEQGQTCQQQSAGRLLPCGRCFAQMCIRDSGIKGEICIDWHADSPLLLDAPLWLQAGDEPPRLVRALS